MGPPGASRFSTLFYVAAIGGKSPRALQLCLELYDDVVAESSARWVAKLSRICVGAARVSIKNPEWERMPRKQLMDFADQTDRCTESANRSNGKKKNRPRDAVGGTRGLFMTAEPTSFTAMISDTAPESISRFRRIRSHSGFLMPAGACEQPAASSRRLTEIR